MLAFLRTLLRDKRGATVIEYGMICAMIVLVIIGALKGMAGESGGFWSAIQTKAGGAMNVS